MEWNLIFSIETNRGIATDRQPAEGEYLRKLPASQCAWFRETPSRYEWTGATMREWPGWEAEQASFAAERAKVAAELAIRQKYDAQLAALGKPYLENEQKSWTVQEQEARAYVADIATSVPYIAAMAAARGITVDILAGKIIENADLFRAESARILGEQQREIDLLNS